MLVSWLGELDTFVEKLIQVFRVAPPGAVTVLIVGTFLIGLLAGLLLARLLRGPKPGKGPPSPEPRPPPPSELEKHIARLKTALKSNEELWRFHDDAPPRHLLNIIHTGKMKVVVLLNLKGGVSKTTLTANIGAYYASLAMKVLLIDMDYQGSLTAMMLLSAGLSGGSSTADSLIDTGNGRLVREAENLEAKLGPVKLLSAGKSLHSVENRVQIGWLIEPKPARDVRFNLLHFLTSDDVSRENFDVVLIDSASADDRYNQCFGSCESLRHSNHPRRPLHSERGHAVGRHQHVVSAPSQPAPQVGRDHPDPDGAGYGVEAFRSREQESADPRSP